MSVIPIVEHDRATPTSEQCAAVDRLAGELARDNPTLAVPEEFRPLVPETLDDMATLHLDDFSEIPLLDQSHEVWHLQQRARLRAGDGDFVVCSAPAVDGYEEYCRDYLGLGSPRWLDPPPSRAGPSGLALACWKDRATRRKIIHELRCGELLALHPHMGTFAVWELAALLQRASRQPVRVIAPPPGVTRWVNNKIAFADTVTRLFGPQMRPRMVAVANFATLSQRVAELAEDARVLVIKLPDSAGGRGNVVIDATLLRGKSLLAICKMLERLIRPLCWDRRNPLLVGCWETDVIGTPSVQLWIPPRLQGPPMVEGIFAQVLVNCEGSFQGSCKADLPGPLGQEIVTRSWLLAELFQRLGYVGRCSFDLILVGDDLGSCRIEFIECNGRWGGTSGPMTLMNRLFGDWTAQPYASSQDHLEGLNRLRFLDLLDGLQSDLYDRRTGRGWIILYNPLQIASSSGISFLVLGSSWSESLRKARVDLPVRLRQLVTRRAETGPVSVRVEIRRVLIDRTGWPASDPKSSEPSWPVVDDRRDRLDLRDNLGIDRQQAPIRDFPPVFLRDRLRGHHDRPVAGLLGMTYMRDAADLAVVNPPPIDPVEGVVPDGRDQGNPVSEDDVELSRLIGADLGAPPCELVNPPGDD
ncbi:MAG: hypothetical protein WBX00_03635 [Isosphaeraceae bacterium]